MPVACSPRVCQLPDSLRTAPRRSEAQTSRAASSTLVFGRRALLAPGGRPRYTEQGASASPAEPPEYARQAEAQASEGGTVLPTAEVTEGDERQKHLRAIAGDLMYWRDGLKVLRQAQLPKWRGSFKWHMEAKIEALQAEYAKLRAEVVKPDG